MLKINIISCLQDNYSYVIEDLSTKKVAVVDPSEFKPIDQFVKENFNKIDYILNTHHHFDHVAKRHISQQQEIIKKVFE